MLHVRPLRTPAPFSGHFCFKNWGQQQYLLLNNTTSYKMWHPIQTNTFPPLRRLSMFVKSIFWGMSPLFPMSFMSTNPQKNSNTDKIIIQSPYSLSRWWKMDWNQNLKLKCTLFGAVLVWWFGGWVDFLRFYLLDMLLCTCQCCAWNCQTVCMNVLYLGSCTYQTPYILMDHSLQWIQSLSWENTHKEKCPRWKCCPDVTPVNHRAWQFIQNVQSGPGQNVFFWKAQLSLICSFYLSSLFIENIFTWPR